jgi:hypothetical protein
MKLLIGITQDLDLTKSNISEKFDHLSEPVEVGPFKTKDEASGWVKFMMDRGTDYEEFVTAETGSLNKPWWGVIFEYHMNN